MFEKDTGMKISLHTLLHTWIPSTLNLNMLTKIKVVCFFKTITYISFSKAQLPQSKVENDSHVEKYSDNIVLIITVHEVSRTDNTFSGRIREYVMDNCQFVNR